MIERPENVKDFRGGPEWETALNDAQREAIAIRAPRYQSMQMEFMDRYGAVMVTGYYESGGKIVLGVEQDGYTHS